MSNSKLVVADVNLCVGCQSCMFACARRFGEAGLERSAIHVGSSGGVERGFIVITCRGCSDPPCMKVCPTNALRKRHGGGVVLNTGKCTGCKNCVDECTVRAIFWDKEMNKPVICVHCGVCSDYCPYDVLKLEKTGGT